MEMYNRYIPQPDGSFRRNRLPCNTPTSPGREPTPAPACREESCYTQQAPCKEPQSVGNFLKNLLPAGFDTGDLIVVLLLLLMAGDCEEDRSTALLTLVLYLFM